MNGGGASEGRRVQDGGQRGGSPRAPFLGKETPVKHALSILLLTASKYIKINSVFSHKKKKNNNGIICQNESGSCYEEPHLVGKDASQSETGQ